MDGAITVSREFSTKITKGSAKVTKRTKDIKKEKKTFYAFSPFVTFVFLLVTFGVDS